MKKLIFVMIFLIIFPLSAYAIDVDDIAPNFSGTTLDGKSFSYHEDFKGKKPAYLIFWATWCSNCKKELPHVEEMYHRLGNKISFIGINVGINERRERVSEYVKKKGLSFPILFDKDFGVGRSYNVMGTPTHIVVDKSGVVRYRGAEMPEDLDEHINELMNE